MFIIFVIVANTITLIMYYDEASQTYNDILNYLNIIFVIIFALEALIKLLGYGPRFYFHENWNRFDFIIVITSLISLDDSLFSVAFNFTALRIIRVARLLRMIKASKGLRNLLKTLYLALGNIMNVGALLLLIFVIIL